MTYCSISASHSFAEKLRDSAQSLWTFTAMLAWLWDHNGIWHHCPHMSDKMANDPRCDSSYQEGRLDSSSVQKQRTHPIESDARGSANPGRWPLPCVLEHELAT